MPIEKVAGILVQNFFPAIGQGNGGCLRGKTRVRHSQQSAGIGKHATAEALDKSGIRATASKRRKEKCRSPTKHGSRSSYRRAAKLCVCDHRCKLAVATSSRHAPSSLLQAYPTSPRQSHRSNSSMPRTRRPTLPASGSAAAVRSPLPAKRGAETRELLTGWPRAALKYHTEKSHNMYCMRLHTRISAYSPMDGLATSVNDDGAAWRGDKRSWHTGLPRVTR